MPFRYHLILLGVWILIVSNPNFRDVQKCNLFMSFLSGGGWSVWLTEVFFLSKCTVRLLSLLKTEFFTWEACFICHHKPWLFSPMLNTLKVNCEFFSCEFIGLQIVSVVQPIIFYFIQNIIPILSYSIIWYFKVDRILYLDVPMLNLSMLLLT